MPRHALPSHLKNLKTYDVVLTQTSEDDLYDHFVSKSQNYEPLVQSFRTDLSAALEDIRDVNPYLNHNWRKGAPDRVYPTGCEWMNVDIESERYLDKFWFLSRLQQDFLICNKEFKWSSNVNKEEFCNEFEFMMYRCIEQIKSDQQELVMYDTIHFNEAKKKWMEKDTEWIENDKKRKDHRYHKPKQFYIDLFKQDPDAIQFYKGIIPDNEETCEFCMHEKTLREEREREEREREEREREELEEREENEEREELERKKNKETKNEIKNEIKVIEQKQRTIMHCEDCNYTTDSLSFFNLHCSGKEHNLTIKQKRLYCKVCDIQCRTNIEYSHHITTRKHKIKSGEIQDNPNYCKVCDYTATTTSNLSTHFKSKKHRANIEKLV